MNDDLIEIHALLRVEQELEALKAEAGDLAAAVKKRRDRVAQREAERSAAEAELVTAREAERALSRQVDDYTRKRDKTRQLIDSGTAPDYHAAERQLVGCQEVLDRLEGELLEAMDAREIIEARIEAAREGAGIEQARVRDALTRQSTRRPGVEARWKELAPERKAKRAAMPRDLLRRYDDLRGRQRPVLVTVTDGSCEHCHMRVPPHVIQNFDRGRLVTCSGCGCWVRTVVETDPEAGADEDED